MEQSDLIPAKASAPEDQSDSIVVSFGTEWYEPLKARQFKAVIRKRVPRTLQPKWLYFHINAPITAVCARAPITRIVELTRPQALKRSADLALEPVLLEEYMRGQDTIGCYELGTIAFPTKQVTIAELSNRMVYHPPQSFFILSRAAKVILDELAGFPASGNRSKKA